MMRSLGFAILLVGVFSCTTPPPSEGSGALSALPTTQGSGVAASEMPNKAAVSCEDESFCTREYLPTVCQYKGQSFRGSNLCEARKLLRRFACEKSLVLAENEIQCESKTEKPFDMVQNCQRRVLCTREMNPHTCSFHNKKFLGSNRCEAMQKVRAFACQHRLELDEQAVQCEPSRNLKGRSK